MHLVQQIQRIRDRIQQEFLVHGGNPDEALQETILICDGFYCGRRFDCDGLQAIWFLEEDQVKLYDRSGALKNVFPASELKAEAA